VFRAVKFWKSASISGTVGDLETDRAEQRFDTFQRARDRMQTAARLPTTRQRHIERLFGEARFQRHLAQRLATRVERCFDGVLGAIDRRTGGLALVRRQLGQALEQLGNLAALAEVSGLDLLKRVGSSVAAKAADAAWTI
jgi:hypothetical protein